MYTCCLYNIGTWIVPEVTGEAPPPCSNFSMVTLGHNRGAMFGGFQPEGRRLSDIFIVELTNSNIVCSHACTYVLIYDILISH